MTTPITYQEKIVSPVSLECTHRRISIGPQIIPIAQTVIYLLQVETETTTYSFWVEKKALDKVYLIFQFVDAQTMNSFVSAIQHEGIFLTMRKVHEVFFGICQQKGLQISGVDHSIEMSNTPNFISRIFSLFFQNSYEQYTESRLLCLDLTTVVRNLQFDRELYNDHKMHIRISFEEQGRKYTLLVTLRAFEKIRILFAHCRNWDPLFISFQPFLEYDTIINHRTSLKILSDLLQSYSTFVTTTNKVQTSLPLFLHQQYSWEEKSLALFSFIHQRLFRELLVTQPAKIFPTTLCRTSFPNVCFESGADTIMQSMIKYLDNQLYGYLQNLNQQKQSPLTEEDIKEFLYLHVFPRGIVIHLEHFDLFIPPFKVRNLITIQEMIQLFTRFLEIKDRLQNDFVHFSRYLTKNFPFLTIGVANNQYHYLLQDDINI